MTTYSCRRGYDKQHVDIECKKVFFFKSTCKSFAQIISQGLENWLAPKIQAKYINIIENTYFKSIRAIIVHKRIWDLIWKFKNKRLFCDQIIEKVDCKELRFIVRWWSSLHYRSCFVYGYRSINSAMASFFEIFQAVEYSWKFFQMRWKEPQSRSVIALANLWQIRQNH